MHCGLLIFFIMTESSNSKKKWAIGTYLRIRPELQDRQVDIDYEIQGKITRKFLII